MLPHHVISQVVVPAEHQGGVEDGEHDAYDVFYEGPGTRSFSYPPYVAHGHLFYQGHQPMTKSQVHAPYIQQGVERKKHRKENIRIMNNKISNITSVMNNAI